jgi:hypothetical protein
MQKGTLVTSTRRAGSQNPTGMPGTKGSGGFGQKQGIWLGLGVSSRPLPLTLTGPIEIGKRQDQQISVIGLTKRPEHALLFELEIKTEITTTRRHQCMIRNNFNFSLRKLTIPFFVFADFFSPSLSSALSTSLEDNSFDDPEGWSFLASADALLIVCVLSWLLYTYCAPQKTWSIWKKLFLFSDTSENMVAEKK